MNNYVDFKEVQHSIDLLQFILSEFPEYGIDPSKKGDKSQTRLVNDKEEIDVFKSKKGWLYFNRTSKFVNGVKDEGNIVQFLRVRYQGEFKKVIKKISDYQNNFDSSLIISREIPTVSKISGHEWQSRKFSLRKDQFDYLASRGISENVFHRNPSLADAMFSYKYINKKGYETYYLGFPLTNNKDKYTGFELRGKPVGRYSGKFAAPGSSKERSYWIANFKTKNKKAVVGESPLDVLAYIQIRGFQDDTTYIATTGRFGQSKALDIISKIKETKANKITLINDNDIHGQAMNVMLASTSVQEGPYIKAYGTKEAKLYMEITNVNESVSQAVDEHLTFVHYLNRGTNYIVVEAAYIPEKVELFISEIQGKEFEIIIDRSNSKDWNQDLLDSTQKLESNNQEISHEKS